ncbi:MAG: hypothetical protein ACI4SG_03865 [Oligosphaeraceae bacterium]
MGNNNVLKAIGSVVVILLAGGLIYWQLAGSKESSTVTTEMRQQASQEEAAAMEVLSSAVAVAEKSGWAATGRFWAPNALNAAMKKRLSQVFGKGVDNPKAILDGNAGRDSESGMQVVIFTYEGNTYAFYLFKDKKGKYLLKDFSNW